MNPLAHILFCCCLAPTVLYASTFGDGIADGKGYGATMNTNAPDATNLSPSTVPGYTSSSPSETQYYGNESAMGDAAAQELQTNEAAKAVTESYTTRPMFTIDRNTDPIFQRMDQVEASAASIAGAMQGEYSECKPTVLTTPNAPSVETCYENRPAQATSCSDVLTIEIEMPTDTVQADGGWTSGSGDCGPDTWSGYSSASCPSGFYGPVPVGVYRQAKWYGDDPWRFDTGWQSSTADWIARTEINCSGNQCTYRTKGVDRGLECSDVFCISTGPMWGTNTCKGDKWYTRMRLRVECRAEPIAHDVWNNGCAELEARSK